MSFDPHKNFAISTVATAPTPASSGTTLDPTDSTVFPTPGVDGAFNVVVWPADTAFPTTSNAEIVRVTAGTTTWTISRAQEGTSARSIVAGDQVALAVSAKVLSDVEAEIVAHASDTTSVHGIADTSAVALISVGTDPPVAPEDGDLWWDTDDATTGSGGVATRLYGNSDDPADQDHTIAANGTAVVTPVMLSGREVILGPLTSGVWIVGFACFFYLAFADPTHQVALGVDLVLSKSDGEPAVDWSNKISDPSYVNGAVVSVSGMADGYALLPPSGIIEVPTDADTYYYSVYSVCQVLGGVENDVVTTATSFRQEPPNNPDAQAVLWGVRIGDL